MKLTNKNNLPQTYFDVVKGLIYDPRESDPNRISITTLINNPRPKLLTVRNWDKLEEDVSEHLWRILGNAAHYVLSRIDESKTSLNRLVETKIEEKVGDITIVGKLDLYDDTTKFVEDYKITSVWSVQMGDHEDWEQQLNCYVWLLRKAGFEVKGAQINAILRDWREGEKLRYNDYPSIPFKVVKVNLWSFEEQQAFVEHRIEIYKDAKDRPEEELPLCSPTERWAKPTEYAVYKGENTKATRVLETAEEAEQYIKHNQSAKAQFKIVERPGTDIKCTRYCTANKFCSYWQEKYGEAEALQA